jgi:hypothetical protein
MRPRQQHNTLHSTVRVASNRRRFLAGAGTALPAGCTNNDGDTDSGTPTDGNGSDEEKIAATPATLERQVRECLTLQANGSFEAAYERLADAATLGIPLFIAQGGRDYQVTVEDDLALWRESLSGMPRVRFETYDELNHLFQQNDDPTANAEQCNASSVLDLRLVEDIVSLVGDTA